ncbi:MAG: 50S ribosomal protein L24 [Candidatus Parcubacteria bacterium]|nr:50S ribosomal protein L24 [Candidatus Parcubacteria bacterium]
MIKIRIKKGDNVIVLKGKDKKKTGKVLKVISSDNKIVVDGLNTFKKHERPKNQGEKGQVVNVSRPINLSNVKVICPTCKKATRIVYKFETKGEKVLKIRVCHKCGAKI